MVHDWQATAYNLTSDEKPLIFQRPQSICDNVLTMLAERILPSLKQNVFNHFSIMTISGPKIR